MRTFEVYKDDDRVAILEANVNKRLEFHSMPNLEAVYAGLLRFVERVYEKWPALCDSLLKEIGATLYDSEGDPIAGLRCSEFSHKEE